MKTIKIYLQIMCVTLIGVLGSCNDPFYGDETFEVLELKKASGQKVVLSQAEIDGILFMREEEKLARVHCDPRNGSHAARLQLN